MTDLDFGFSPLTRTSQSEGSLCEEDPSRNQIVGVSAGVVQPVGEEWPFSGLADTVQYDISRANQPTPRPPSAATTDRTILIPLPPTRSSTGRSLQGDDYRSGIGNDRDSGNLFDFNQPVEKSIEDPSLSSLALPGPSQRAETAMPAQHPSFLDRQDSAQKVLWNSQRRDEPLEKLSQPTGRQNGKRAAWVLNDSEDRSQTGTPDIDTQSRRFQIPARELDSQSEPAYEGGDGVNPDTPRSDLEIPRSLQQLHEEFGDVEQRARVVTFQTSHHSSSVKIPWSEAENKALLRGIASYGPSWAFIKNTDTAGALKRRNQVALKDKARNMKVSYLM
jgi:hypothetical protein